MLELEDLQDMLISICNHLNRPIRKNQLIKMVTDLFECSTPKQIEFVLIGLLEQKKLCQQDYFIITPEFATSWNGTVTATDEGIVKFLLSLKEDTKFDIFFNVYAKEHLTPSIFFKYVEMQYPALLHRTDTALTYMEQMNNTFSYVSFLSPHPPTISVIAIISTIAKILFFFIKIHSPFQKILSTAPQLLFYSTFVATALNSDSFTMKLYHSPPSSSFSINRITTQSYGLCVT